MDLRGIWDGVRGLFTRGAMEREIAEEVAFHIERETERNLREGVAPAEARRRALVAFGGTDRFVESARREHRSVWLEEFLRDVWLAARALRRTPGFALVVIISLGVGIGANTAIFSVVNGVLLRPLPYREPDELLSVGVQNVNQPFASVSSVADVVALAASPAFAEIGAYGPQQGGFALTVGDVTESVFGSWVSAGLLRALGVAPARGRLLVDEDNEPGRVPVVLLAHGLWLDRFGGSEAVIGSTLQLDGEAVTVVGVMPAGFQLPGARNERLWVAAEVTPPDWRAPFWLRVVARPAAGLSEQAIAAELERVRAEVMARYPGTAGGWHYVAEPLRDTLVRDARLTLAVLGAAVVLVLVMAAANVANLLLARATVQAPELALRSALGAGRGRLVRHLMAETAVLGTLGGGLGLVLAWAGVRVIPVLAPGGLPRREEIAIDASVLAFALAATAIVGVAVGVLPALHATRPNLLAFVRERTRGSDARTGVRARSALVVLEFALALAVVIGAGLVVNSLLRLQRVDSGAETTGVLAVRISIPESRYATEAEVGAFYDALVRDVGALPGVVAAGVGMAVPPNRLVMRNPFTPEGKVYAQDERAPVAAQLLVDSGFFATFGIRPIAGRLFDARDDEAARLVAIIDEVMARQHFAGVNPVGRWLQTGDPSPDAPRMEIVGVVPQVKYAGFDAPPEPTLYVPYAQARWWRSMYLTARTTGDPASLVPGVRARVAAIDPLVPLQEIRTIEQLAHESVATPRFRAILLGSFGAVALLLACAGIYGVMAYEVARRRREVGIRLAIGAEPRSVIREIIARGMRLAGAGIVLGALLALAATRLMAGILFGIDPLDPATFAAAAATLAVIGVAACAIPAWRAARTDPLEAIRTE